MMMTRSLDDIEDYELKARLSIPIDHPHREEVRSLLTAQVNDELYDYANRRTVQGAGRS